MKPPGGTCPSTRRAGLAASLALLAGCGLPPGAYVDSMDSRPILAEFPTVARNCELPEATLLRFTDEGRRFRLLLPASLYAQRAAPPTHGRIQCLLHWGRERGVRLVVHGSRR